MHQVLISCVQVIDEIYEKYLKAAFQVLLRFPESASLLAYIHMRMLHILEANIYFLKVE
jgi:hypothetical protein